MADKFSVYQVVTDRIIEALEKGTVPWRRPFKSAGGNAHANLKSKKAYRGINVMLLDLTAMTEGYTSNWWVTFKQAQELSGPLLDPKTGKQVVKNGQAQWKGGVQKGEKSTIITFWKRLVVEDRNNPGQDKVIPMLRYYRVFNVEQCVGIEDKIPAVETPVEFDPIEAAESLWDEWVNKPEVIFGGNKAAYYPAKDTIQMPNRDQFTSGPGFYATLFHEGVHSSGHTSRLNRDGVMKSAGFGTSMYSQEELVAEIGSAFLNSMCGIEADTFDNSVSYLKSWIQVLNNDPKMIVKAAGDAQKAVDHILNVQWDNTEKQEG